ncbi:MULTISPECIES: hypothetical protein [unclassified Streptomyces]|uniref:hypothetical protein n=1 Tax=unclassified Streptomyces TaxID=2593676 RepID=UPI00331DD076
MNWWPWRRQKAASTRVYGGSVAAGRDIIVHASEADPVVQLSIAARDFISWADLGWEAHGGGMDGGPAYEWELRALMQVDDALVRLRAEAARAGAMRPDLAAMADKIASEAHDARQFCTEDFVPTEDTTSHFLWHLRSLRSLPTEFTQAA